MFAAKDTLLTRPSGGYQISRSVRLRASASAYLNRTLTTPTNNKIWTWSAWVKRGIFGTIAGRTLFRAGVSSPSNGIRFEATTDVLRLFFNDASSGDLITTQVFRDPAAWYHIIVAVDTTQATAANRAKIYINGTQVTAFSTASYPAQNYDPQINSAILHTIGAFNASGTPSEFFDGYLTEVNFIDGQALTPSSFGETNAVTGVWQPKKYAGTYGTNGFYLNFSDNSASTAATIGKDYSGNGNNWTPNNISVTAGVTYDSMLDVPTNYADGGNGRGNYCVLNPLDRNTNLAPSDANLTYAVSGAVQYFTRSTIFLTSGKWYAEFTISSSSAVIAITNQSAVVQGLNGLNGVFALTTQIYNNSGTAAQTGLAAFVASDVIGVAYDADTNSVQFYRNNSTYGTAVTPSATGPFCFHVGGNGACTVNANFGQRPFTYTPPSGFVALNTQNLPTPTISNGANYMAATLWTGDGTGSRTIVNSANGISFQPDWVWWKNRTTGKWNQVFDSVRGADKALSTNATDAEDASGGYGGEGSVTAFNSNGYTLQGGVGNNENGSGIVGWSWKANGAGVTNTSGSITSTVSANTTAGFSVATFTKNASTNETIGHGLGVAPTMIIVKTRGSAGFVNWAVWHTSIGIGNFIELNTTAASQASTTIWNNTLPTSTVFSMGTAWTAASNSMVAYCFAPVAGYSAFGSYTGNGSTDGPFVFTGFRPRFVLFKKSSAADDWVIYDTSRDTYNVTSKNLYANGSFAEDTNTTNRAADILSNGFKIRSSATFLNLNAATFIYMAFAENPFKLSLAR